MVGSSIETCRTVVSLCWGSRTTLGPTRAWTANVSRTRRCVGVVAGERDQLIFLIKGQARCRTVYQLAHVHALYRDCKISPAVCLCLANTESILTADKLGSLCESLRIVQCRECEDGTGQASQEIERLHVE